jgi:hypothetical protein
VECFAGPSLFPDRSVDTSISHVPILSGLRVSLPELPAKKSNVLEQARHPLTDMSFFSSEELSKGWEFKLADDQCPESWLLVAKVPTVVHLDLMANNKYARVSIFTGFDLTEG